MEGIYVGKVKRSVINKDDVNLLFVDHRQDMHHLGEVIDYEDTAYCLVPTNDIIINNDELLKLREQVEKLEAELTEIKTTRTLREAYITGVEKGCESLREDRDLWKRRWNSVVTDIAKSLEANGIEFTLKEVHGNGNWDVVIDIPELNEAKKKVEDLEKKLKAAESKETFLRGRKEEEEDYHRYWWHTFDRAVKQAADKGIHIDVRGTDEDCNAGVVVVDNMKAEELESQVVQMEDANQKLRKRISTADEEIEELERKHDAKWSAMTEALKDKGVEVIYMGEEDGKPCVYVKVPEIDILKKELETLKSRTLDNVEIRLSCGDIVWTYCDGFIHVSSGIINADEISTGTVPKCSSCAHYMHNPSRFAHDWCYMPIPKEGGAGYIRKLNKEEAEGPACDKFEAKKEAECKDCKYYRSGSWRSRKDGEAMAECKSPSTRYGFCKNNCNGEKACPEFEAKE